MNTEQLRIQVPKEKKLITRTGVTRSPVTRSPVASLTTPIFNTSNMEYVGIKSNRSLVNIQSTASTRSSASVSPAVSVASSVSLLNNNNNNNNNTRKTKNNVVKNSYYSNSFRNTKDKMFHLKNISNNKFKPIYNEYKQIEKAKANTIKNWNKPTKRKWWNVSSYLKTGKKTTTRKLRR